jgi:predicted glycoside hydrolase/deacetylase ChbG (UPF0249 family)
MKYFPMLTLFATILISINAYGQPKNLAEKLGYPKDAKLLIIHADDAALSSTVDSAIISALEKRQINSASIMVPCPDFPQLAAYAKQHPEYDWGIHLTFTSEWKNLKWPGVAPAAAIRSLQGQDGNLHATNEDVRKNATLKEIEIEMRAQIDKAISNGIKLTHLDNHMGSILGSPEIIKIYQKIGKEYKLPVLIPMNMLHRMAPALLVHIDTTGAVVNEFISAYGAVPPDKWKDFYNQKIQNLKPGLNELIFHLAFDNSEMKAITIDHPDFGSAWRQRDYDYATSKEFRDLIKEHGIILVTWGEIKRVQYD